VADLKPAYKRVLLKLSGQALRGESSFGISPSILDRIASEIGDILELGVELGLVIGGGNFFRGQELSVSGLGRITADHMGMLATVMNSLAMRDSLERAGFATRIMSAIPMSGVVDHYDRRKAIHHLQEKRIVLFAAGTGNPLVTTDTAASLRAIEVEADILLKATNVDGIYSADPKKNPSAHLINNLSFNDVLAKELGVMDLAAFTQCRDHNLKIRIFNLAKQGALLNCVLGRDEGTLVE